MPDDLTQEDVAKAISEALKAKDEEFAAKIAEKDAENKALAEKLAEFEKEKLTDIERQILEAKENTKKEFEPVVARAAKLEETFKKLLEAELADVPDDKKALIPELPSVEDKLEWIQQAKKAGLFGTQKQTSSSQIPPNQTTKSEGNGQNRDEELLKTPEGRRQVLDRLKKDFGVRFRFGLFNKKEGSK